MRLLGTTQSMTQSTTEGWCPWFNALSILRRNRFYLLSSLHLHCKNYQFINPRQLFEQFCGVLPVFGSNSAKYDNNLIESCSLPISVTRRDFESTTIRKVIQLVFFIIGDFELLGKVFFLVGPQNQQKKRNQRFSPYDSFDSPEQLNIEFPSYYTLFSALCNSKTWPTLKVSFWVAHQQNKRNLS